MSSVDPAPKRKKPSSRSRIVSSKRSFVSEDHDLELTEELRKCIGCHYSHDPQKAAQDIYEGTFPDPSVLDNLYLKTGGEVPTSITGCLYTALKDNFRKREQI